MARGTSSACTTDRDADEMWHAGSGRLPAKADSVVPVPVPDAE